MERRRALVSWSASFRVCSFSLLAWRIATTFGAATAGRGAFLGAGPLSSGRLPTGGDGAGGKLAMVESIQQRVAPRAVTNSLGVFKGRFQTVQASRADLEEAANLCIAVFFGEAESPWKAQQLAQLLQEQRADLDSRCMRMRENAMFKTVDTRRGNRMVGFVEISAVPGSRYGMGPGVPEADYRPVVANLAVERQARRCGIGSSLMEACEDVARSWGYNELTLQVEEDNHTARDFYERNGFYPLFVDRAARKYDTSGFLLQNVRCSKVMLRKALPYMAPAPLPPQHPPRFQPQPRLANGRVGSQRIVAAISRVFNWA